MMKLNKLAPLVIIIVLSIVLLIVRTCKNQAPSTVNVPSTTTITNETRGLNRNPSIINYSKHARCRMQCRKITEAEIKKVLREGTINYKKSSLQQAPCKKRYAVESIVNKQHIRIIVAPCEDELTVITCIDTKEEWACDCP
ncbi:MAG TPA: DUF4258 domain-containing protein [Flavipsychrobacter sp.]|jgi:hypothetical protein|nr:DUF4258 domain-containing protein [Flavipsychrobacter sp.]